MVFFMKGKKFRVLSNSTIDRFLKRGYRVLIWRNGDEVIL